MRFAAEAWPIVIPIAVLGIAFVIVGFLLSSAVLIGAGWIVVVLSLLALLFFRDPERLAPNDPLAVVSPADGRVLQTEIFPDGTRHFSVFLSVFDVHVNRVPYGGVVSSVKMTPGSYVHAGGAAAAEGNARSEIRADTDRGPIAWRQVSGLIARKISCRVKPGDSVATGARFGLIYFGSRMDVFLPNGSNLCVQPGDRVLAGETVIAKFTKEDDR